MGLIILSLVIYIAYDCGVKQYAKGNDDKKYVDIEISQQEGLIAAK